MSTPAHTSGGLRSALEYIQGVFGPNFFAINASRVMAWSDQLRDLDDAQLIEGARHACAHAVRGQPPMPSDIRGHLLGRWESRKVARVDANLNPNPSELGYEYMLVLVEPSTGRALRAFNSAGDLVDAGTQAHIASRAKVERETPHLLPPASMVAQITRENFAEVARLESRGRSIDFHSAIPAQVAK